MGYNDLPQVIFCNNLEWALRERIKGGVYCDYIEKDDTMRVKVVHGNIRWVHIFPCVTLRMMDGSTMQAEYVAKKFKAWIRREFFKA